LRAIRPELITGYREKWELLLSPPETAPLLVRDSYRRILERFGRPEDHALIAAADTP
jgi:hypothetical protein